MDAGSGIRSLDGIGCPMIPGGGVSVTMGAGTGAWVWAGTGFPPATGALPGCIGITVMTMLDGHL